MPPTGSPIKESIFATTYPYFSAHITCPASLLLDLLADMPHPAAGSQAQRLLAPLVRSKFAAENWRLMAEFKRHTESLAG